MIKACAAVRSRGVLVMVELKMIGERSELWLELLLIKTLISDHSHLKESRARAVGLVEAVAFRR